MSGKALAANKDLARKLALLERRIASHDESIRLLFQAIRNLMNEPVPPGKRIGFQLKERATIYLVQPKRMRQKTNIHPEKP